MDENLVVVRGGSTPDRDGFDDPWPPLDSFQAPYRNEDHADRPVAVKPTTFLYKTWLYQCIYCHCVLYQDGLDQFNFCFVHAFIA